MTKNPNIAFFKTTDLLELSLSIGKHHDFKNNAKDFSSALKKLLNLTSCEIWIQEEQSNYFKKIFTNNRKILHSDEFEDAPPFFNFKKNQNQNSEIINATSLKILKHFTNHQKGVLYSFKLSSGFFLLAFDSKTQNLFSSSLLSTLEPFLSRFYISIRQSEPKQKLDKLESGSLGTEQEIEKYKLVVDNVSDGLVILNLDQKIVYTNQRLAELSEYTVNEIVGKHINVIALSQDMIPAIQDNIKKVFKGESVQFSFKHIKKTTKKEWWVSGKLSPYKNTESKIIGAIASLRDITTERAVQKELEESKTHYNMLINSGFDGVMTVDLVQNKIIDVNDKLLKLLSYEREEFLNLNVEKMAPEDQGNGIKSRTYLSQINKEVQNKGTINYEWIHRKKDGSLTYVDVIAINLPPPNAHIKIEIHKDNTQKYLASQILKSSEERMSKLFDLSPIPILIRSINSLKFKLVNKKFTELFGYTIDELNQKTRNELVYMEDVAEIERQMKRLKSGEISDFNLEKQYIRKDGSTFWGRATRSIVEFEDEKFLVGFIQDITERKKAIASMKGSEAKVRAIFDSTSDKIVALDRNFRIIDYNKSAELFFRDFQENITFQLGAEFLPFNPEVRKDRLHHYEQALKGKSVTLNRNYSISKQGKVDLINILPIKDEKQNVIGITLYGKDITELIETQSALEKREIQLNEAQRIAKIGDWEFNFETQEFNWSEGSFRILGLSKAKVAPRFKEYCKKVHPDDLPILLKSIEQIKDGLLSELEIRHFTESGQLIYTIIKGETLSKDGKIIKFFGTIQDITTRKEVEFELIESNKKYQDLFNNMYDALLVTDREGYFIDANKAAQRLLEYSLEELKEIRILEIVYPDDREKSFEYLNKLQSEGFYSNYEGRIVTKSGKVKFLQVNSNAIIENGELIGSRDIARDITLLKNAEAKREQLFSQLELVNKELKDFAYIVSHDLKAPLRAISSLSNWIAEDYAEHFDEEGKKHLSLLTGRATRMQRFIEGILEYSRLGRIKINKEMVDIKSLLHLIIDSLDPPKQFLIKIANNIPSIRCEKVRIHQVFQNLISNAIKYNDKQQGIIEIKFHEEEHFYFFSIKDNGQGIDERHFEKVFKIFQTLQPRDELESTGVGLTIVKRIVELHGGKVTIKSKPLEGSTFTFSLLKNIQE